MRITLLSILFLILGLSTHATEYKYWHGKVRELRYAPVGDDFVIINGKQKYTRALYGTNTAFRVETSDMPEFGLFMPHMGGNIQLGLLIGDKSLWLGQASYIKSIYRAGSRLYEVTDPMMGKGTIQITVLAMADADGMVLNISGTDFPSETKLLVMYGGANGKRFFRNADLGVDIANAFDLHPDACLNNDFALNGNTFTLQYGQGTRNPKTVSGTFPQNTQLKTGSPYQISSPAQVWNSTATDNKPVLTASIDAGTSFNHYFAIKTNDDKPITANQLETVFNKAEEKRQEIASTVKISTPDPYLNPFGGVLSMAADGIWDDCWMHGAIGWRMPLNGWRAAYTGDLIGWHDRNRTHFDNYAASQVTEVEPVIPHPAQDSALNLARSLKKWGTQMYSNGYICRNPNNNSQMHHYDMNQAYIDELLWHLNWTGDMDYAKSIWPVIERHLAWEKRNFDPNNDGLYDACASIWASDALYYNSGGVTHGSAYNYRANKMAAEIAAKIGVDPSPYQKEADKILNAINTRLWLSKEGHWAEFQDLMGHQLLHNSPAIWTIYHAIDSDIHTPFQAYQATRYIDNHIPRIPVRAEGLPDEGYYTISTTNWLPYSWSINNVAFAEVAHTCLAYWQTGRNNEAFHLFKSAVLDGMYLGASPGNIGQISFYDAARGECYRDFGDPVGMYARALIQGLFGITPDLMNQRLLLKPGFPSDWDHASVSTASIDFAFKRTKNTDRYTVKNRLGKNTKVELQLKAHYTAIKSLTVNGKAHSYKWVDGIETPEILLVCDPAEAHAIEITWQGKALKNEAHNVTGILGETLSLKTSQQIVEVYDPQQALSNTSFNKKQLSGTIAGLLGHRTIFVKVKQGEAQWWVPVSLEIKEPFEFENQEKSQQLQFAIHNNSNSTQKFEVLVNPGKSSFSKSFTLKSGAISPIIDVPAHASVFGSNRVVITQNGQAVFESKLINWNLKNQQPSYEMVQMDKHLNASVAGIFKQQYLSPRSPYTTLQIPTQGIGEWCHPNLNANIDDSGLRQAIRNNTFETPMGIPFRSVAEPQANNVAFTALWDNYPDSLSLSLSGKASHAYLLMAGSTNHMQCHMVNGKITVTYTDGSTETLELVNPDNWVPIEQDLFIDDHAFKTKHSRPYRVAFKPAIVSRNLEADMNIKPSEVYGRAIDGGAGIILDMPLDNSKTLKSLDLETITNEVIIGIMGITLVR